MSGLTDLGQRWKNLSSRTRFLASSTAGLVLIIAVIVSVSLGAQNQATELPKALIQMPSATQSESPTFSATPSPTSTPSPTEEVSQKPQESQRQPAPQTEVVVAAPVISPATASASQYGIAQLFNTVNQPVPTGLLFATTALPEAQGTGPIVYSVTGLPTGAGFDSASRKIYVDGTPFFDANKVGFQDQANCPQWKVTLSLNVQYSATGPGGTSSISVPVSFGIAAVPGGMFHFGC